ncbi:uncharacterized mitochondrial protein-like protein, partial [Tanacetum coccineum]
MKDKFQMSSILTFFLGLQVKQKEDGIFISQDKYVAEVLRKFNFPDVKSASTPVDTEKTLVKDADGISALPNTEIFDQLSLMGVEWATTTAASLDAAQASGNITKTQSTTIPNVPFPQGIGAGGVAKNVHTYTRRRRSVSTRSGRVSTASRLFSTAEESVSTAGASMPISTAGTVQEVNKDKAAIRLQEQLDEEERQRIARVHEEGSFNIE